MTAVKRENLKRRPWPIGMCEKNLVRRIPCRHLLGLKPGFDKNIFKKKKRLTKRITPISN